MFKNRRALLLNTSALEKSAAEEDQLARHVFAMGYADMASSLFRQGFLDRAEEAFKNALVVDPVVMMSPTFMLISHKTLVQVRNDYGNLLKSTGRSAAAKECYTLALNQQPTLAVGIATGIDHITFIQTHAHIGPLLNLPHLGMISLLRSLSWIIHSLSLEALSVCVSLGTRSNSPTFLSSPTARLRFMAHTNCPFRAHGWQVAWNNLGCVSLDEGNGTAAMEQFTRAIYYDHTLECAYTNLVPREMRVMRER